MILNLSTLSVHKEKGETILPITKRLPPHLAEACELSCVYSVENCSTFYLLHLRITGLISTICQRCAQIFPFFCDSESTLALCSTDEQAEKLLSHYETVVIEHDKVDLLELVTDDLHLNSPLFHPDVALCDKFADKFIRI